MGLKYIIYSIIMALPLITVVPALADTTLGIQGSNQLNTTIQIKNGKGRISSSGRKDYLLYDSDTKIITYVEPGYKQYTQLTVADIEAAVQAATSIKETVAPYMDDILAGLSVEQRNMVEQRMGSMLGAPAAGKSVKPANIRIVDQGKQTVAGLQCRASSLVRNGRTVTEICMVTSASGKLSSQDFATLETLVTLSRSMAGHANGMLGGMGEQAELLAVGLKGIPVNVKDLEHGKYYQVTRVSDAVLPDVLFNDYGEFKQQGMQNLLR